MNRPKSGRAADADTLFLEVVLQFAGLEHLHLGIAAIHCTAKGDILRPLRSHRSLVVPGQTPSSGTPSPGSRTTPDSEDRS